MVVVFDMRGRLCQDGGAAAFARNLRDNFDEIVWRGVSYRILTSSLRLPISFDFDLGWKFIKDCMCIATKIHMQSAFSSTSFLLTP